MKMELVEMLRASALRNSSSDDADFLEGEAYSKRPDLHWQKEEINNGKYIVKGG